MSRLVRRRLVVAALAVLAGPAVVLAQGVLAQLGLTEASARKHVLYTIEGGGAMSDPMVDAARTAYAKLAPTARGPATTAFYAWTRAYVSSAAFRAAYDERRTERMPQPVRYAATVDQELKAKVDGTMSEMEAGMKQALAMLPLAERPKAEAQFRKDMASMMSPEMVQALRAGLEEDRARSNADHDLGMEQWNKNLPADPMVRVARHLREFLDATADVDFVATYSTKQGMVGPYTVFDNPAYNDKPWQWQHSYYVGPEALAAGRAAAAAWLKELPGK